MRCVILLGILAAVAQAKQIELSADATALSLEQEHTDADEEESDDGEEVQQETLTSQQVRAIHHEADVDNDGKVSMAELLDYSQMMRQIIAIKDVHAGMGEMDSNMDGKLSYAELLAHVDQWGSDGNDEVKKYAGEQREIEKQKFKAADEDKNGVLDKDELPGLFRPDSHEGMIQMTSAGFLKHKDKDGDYELSHQEFTQDMDDDEVDFHKLDTDHSGSLDMDEIMAWRSGSTQTEEAMNKLFEVADKDHDEHLTADELDNAREAIAGTDAQYQLMEWGEHAYLDDF